MLWQIFGIILVGLIVTYLVLARRSLSIPSSVFFITLLGVVIGLSVGALVSLPLSGLDDPLGQLLPIVVNIFSVAVVTTFFYAQRENIIRSLSQFLSLVNSLVKETRSIKHDTSEQDKTNPIIIDTSIIIDGRILDLVKTGFISGRLIVPHFVLDELQLIADSEEVLRRNKGRRGLEALNNLKREPNVDVDIVDDDFINENDVDSKIIRLAKKYKGRLMT
ncbi:hypothetical protein DRH29_05585, partial [candidate division Kazan bacterium]